MSIDIIGDTIYYMNKPVADIRDDVMPSFRDKFQECIEDDLNQSGYDYGFDCGFDCGVGQGYSSGYQQGYKTCLEKHGIKE